MVEQFAEKTSPPGFLSMNAEGEHENEQKEKTMKHNTHIYLAVKSIEMMLEGVRKLKSPTITADAKVLQRMLYTYRDSIREASWAPDDILNDKVQYHTFKLFTDREFPDSKQYAKEIYAQNYYRTTGGGGVAFKVDHLAHVLADMNKLRIYNDRCSMEQIMYYFFLLTHYIADAHVPMHCDLRDDPPSEGDTTKPRNGIFFPESLHGKIESLWDDAVTPLALVQQMIEKSTADDTGKETELTRYVKFDVLLKNDREEINPVRIKDSLMQFVIDICIRSKERSLDLFPLDNPQNYDQEKFKTATRKIFAECISNIISVWMWIWVK